MLDNTKMKTTLNAEELRELTACPSGYKVFLKAHGERTVTLSAALKSNGWSDFWWFIGATRGLSASQAADLRNLACDYAEDVLLIFESKYPSDTRPRDAINVARRFASGNATTTELSVAGAAARAARNAAWAAGARVADAAWAAGAAADAARYAARGAGDATREGQERKLKKLLKKWEQSC